MVYNLLYWIAKECEKTPLGNVNKEKSHFSSYLCIILEVGTFFCNPVWQILYHVTCCCKRPIETSIVAVQVLLPLIVITDVIIFCLVFILLLIVLVTLNCQQGLEIGIF